MDITKIEGYSDTLTAEQKLDLLLKYNPPAPDYTGWIKKDSFDRAASELAEVKKALKAKMTEDEQKEADRVASEAAIKAEIESLRKDKAISESKSKFLGLGYDEQLAIDTATAMASGDMEKVFANQKIHIENVRKTERAKSMAGEQNPPPGSNTGSPVDFTKSIAEAMANSDFGLAAALQRQQQEPLMKKT